MLPKIVMPMPRMKMSIGGKAEEAPEREIVSKVAHGVCSIVGPTGAGKTLLAATFAWAAHNKICTICPPGTKTECYEKRMAGYPIRWRTMGNMKSPKFLTWGEFLEDLDQLDTPDGHIKLILDEAHQIVDSRDTQSEQNKVVSYVVSQTRKDMIMVYVTSQAIGKIELRLRNETKIFYNGWNPDGRGRVVGAVIQRQSDGTVPPWLRANPKPIVRFWRTAHMHERYDSWEVVETDNILARNTDRPVRAFTADGDVVTVPLSALVRESLWKSIQKMLQEDADVEGIYLQPEEMAEGITETHNLRPGVSRREVQRLMEADAYIMDGTNGFWIPKGQAA